MKKTTFIICLYFLGSLYLFAQGNSQSQSAVYNDNDDSNWAYTSNIPFYSNNNSTDVWQRQSGSNGRISGPFKGPSYIAGRDLDNPYSQQYTGLASPEHILTFQTINLNGLSAEISFRLNYVGIDSGDYIYFEIAYNDGTGWNNPDYRQDVFKTTQSGTFNSFGWEKVTFNIPSGKSYVRMRLVIYQNGNEYLGFDDFEFKTFSLSAKENAIEGFSFGPNPTQGELKLKANVVLDRVSFYNILGKEIINKTINSKEAILDLSNLSTGMYLAKLESNGTTQTFKVIKK